jgi:hypothetical protein
LRKSASEFPTFLTPWITPEEIRKESPVLKYHRRLLIEVVFQCTFDDVDELLTRMRMPGRFFCFVEVLSVE